MIMVDVTMLKKLPFEIKTKSLLKNWIKLFTYASITILHGEIG